MPFRFIVRPQGILSTPRLLKQALRAQRTLRWPGPSHRKPSYLKDFFLTYPPIEELEEYAQNQSIQSSRSTNGGRELLSTGHSNIHQSWMDSYSTARAFASASKPSQRLLLHQHGFPVPRTSFSSPNPSISTSQSTDSTIEAIWFGVDRSGRDHGISSVQYIVRPLRHSGGQGYRLTNNPSDYEEGREYIQEVYPKNHEYRIIVVRGKPLLTLYKRRPETLTYEQPWNHANGSSFVTVDNPDNNRLRHTDVYERINNASGLLNNLDLVGIDVMYARRGEYVITEFNLCPAITLEHNLQKVAEHVNSDSFLSR